MATVNTQSLDYNERPAISKLCRVKERKRKTKIEDN